MLSWSHPVLFHPLWQLYPLPWAGISLLLPEKVFPAKTALHHSFHYIYVPMKSRPFSPHWPGTKRDYHWTLLNFDRLWITSTVESRLIAAHKQSLSFSLRIGIAK